MTRPSKERNTKRNPTNTKAFSSSFHSEKWEIERLFIKPFFMFLMIIVVHNWFEKTKCRWNLRKSENNRVWQILEDVWQIWTQKLIWAPMRPLLETNHSTTVCSDQFFFPLANQSENAKIRFVGGKKIAECEIGHWRKSSTYETPLVVLTDLRATKNVSSDFVKFFEIFLQGQDR